MRENKSVWTVDTSGKAAIWICGQRTFEEKMAMQRAGFVWAKVNGIYFLSSYAPPSITHEEFERMVDNITTTARGRNCVVIAGDFNAWAVEWGSHSTNARGRPLLEVFASLDLVLANSESELTFSKNRRGSIIDITFVSTS